MASGKTALLKCLNGILKPKGAIYVEKMDMKKLEPSEIAKKFGYVPQRGEINFLTVFDAILLGRKPYLRWDVSEKDIKIVEETIKMLKIEHLAIRKLNELSGGELQLVLIARAFAQQPKYLLLDEPTNNLDIRNQIEVMRLIKRAVEEKGISALVTMHDINLALNYAEKILLLKNGKIFAFGSRDVINSEILNAVYGIKAEILRYDGRILVVPEL
ncbi:MAG: ABC transporter ATP-binding protein [Archaeoglobaceae archaeon]|nr:ABC transporter ATP-binding protein [Archaeoglobaceae archaeon]MDW8128785.1 ABC transporter ATP-binding protein [Archaeoglobaceae archaeon]